ncbi:hypothetical protein DB88DRAFT_41150 [Papiliotrema laurentii]|uniref:Mitochondrial adapter protein MCP1 transmembrane domain-containing protein n=1 Tax=Papiliotrema laurentii TaxID=5418 RepID=A0AAD9FWP9_PAPLA|nr:hypothetical protein DB88DRAFT_41150 [Papiliotrema laurentii]
MPEDKPKSPSGPSLPRTGSVLRVLTLTQNCSALVFSGFLAVHLVSPIAATLGGTSLADSTLLLGREYYLPSETLTIYLPLAVHLGSATLKRLLIYSKTLRPPPLTPHLLTGWMLPFLLVPHIASHRLLPASPDPPIARLSPSEFGFEYVGWALNHSPIWSYASYLGLIGLGVWHSGVGMMKIVSWLKRGRGVSTSTGDDTASSAPFPATAFLPEDEMEREVRPKRTISRRRKFGLRSVLVAFLGFIAVGLACMAKENRSVSKVMAARYEAVYAGLMPRWLA